MPRGGGRGRGRGRGRALKVSIPMPDEEDEVGNESVESSPQIDVEKEDGNEATMKLPEGKNLDPKSHGQDGNKMGSEGTRRQHLESLCSVLLTKHDSRRPEDARKESSTEHPRKVGKSAADVLDEIGKSEKPLAAELRSKPVNEHARRDLGTTSKSELKSSSSELLPKKKAILIAPASDVMDNIARAMNERGNSGENTQFKGKSTNVSYKIPKKTLMIDGCPPAPGMTAQNVAPKDDRQYRSDHMGKMSAERDLGARRVKELEEEANAAKTQLRTALSKLLDSVLPAFGELPCDFSLIKTLVNSGSWDELRDLVAQKRSGYEKEANDWKSKCHQLEQQITGYKQLGRECQDEFNDAQRKFERISHECQDQFHDAQRKFEKLQKSLATLVQPGTPNPAIMNTVSGWQSSVTSSTLPPAKPRTPILAKPLATADPPFQTRDASTPSRQSLVTGPPVNSPPFLPSRGGGGYPSRRPFQYARTTTRGGGMTGRGQYDSRGGMTGRGQFQQHRHSYEYNGDQQNEFGNGPMEPKRQRIDYTDYDNDGDH